MFAEFLARNDLESIRVALSTVHPADAAAVLAGMPAAEAARVLTALHERKAADILAFLEPEAQGAIAARLGRGELARIVAAMAHDERADLFNRLSEAEHEALLPALAATEREDIRKLASYPEGSAGSITTSDYAALAPELTVAEAIAELRREAPDEETIDDAYVIDEARRLVGVVSLRDLPVARDRATVGEIMRREVIAARVEDPRELVAQEIAEYDLLALPIVDGDEKLVGIVTVDDAMDVAERERARRLVRFGGARRAGSRHPPVALRRDVRPVLLLARALDRVRDRHQPLRRGAGGDPRGDRDPRRVHGPDHRHGRQHRHPVGDARHPGDGAWPGPDRVAGLLPCAAP